MKIKEYIERQFKNYHSQIVTPFSNKVTDFLDNFAHEEEGIGRNHNLIGFEPFEAVSNDGSITLSVDEEQIFHIRVNEGVTPSGWISVPIPKDKIYGLENFQHGGRFRTYITSLSEKSNWTYFGSFYIGGKSLKYGQAKPKINKSVSDMTTLEPIPPEKLVMTFGTNANNFSTNVDTFRLWITEGEEEYPYQKYGEAVNGMALNEKYIDKYANRAIKKLESIVADLLKRNAVTYYEIMPSRTELLDMKGNQLFFTKGFYDVYDNNGGFYYLSSTCIKGGYPLYEDDEKHDNPNKHDEKKWLYALDGNGEFSADIPVCRYGVKAFPIAYGMTDERLADESITNATANSRILYNLIHSASWIANYTQLVFNTGKFIFAEPLDLTFRSVGIRGKHSIRLGQPNAVFGGDGAKCTALIFPFLKDGETALTIGMGSIEHICVAGNPNTYDFSINRNPNGDYTIGTYDQVVNETIAKDTEGNEIKTRGIYCKNTTTLHDVEVFNFYTGMYMETTNVYFSNFNCGACHLGLSIGNDTKLIGVYGWNVHTLLQFRGAISSATSVRVDSCVNVINCIGTCSGLTVTDVDGDYCVDSLILVGIEETNAFANLNGSVFVGIHGRCCCLKPYASATEEPQKASDLGTATEGYGLIRAVGQGHIQNNYFLINTNGGNPFDKEVEQKWRTPPILLTYKPQWTSIRNNLFVLANDYANLENPADLFQTVGNYMHNNGENNAFNATLQTPKGMWFIERNGKVTSMAEKNLGVESYEDIDFASKYKVGGDK